MERAIRFDSPGLFLGSSSARKRFFALDEQNNSAQLLDVDTGFVAETTIESISNQRQKIARSNGFPLLASTEPIGIFADSEACDNLSDCYVLPEPSTCSHCGALKLSKETKNFCCANGRIILKINDVPDELWSLFTSGSYESIEFMKNVRGYNSNFSMTSFGVHYDKSLFEDYNGIYTFRIQGQVYHFINEIIPSEGHPSHLQLYFIDTEHEIENRLHVGNRLNETCLMKIMNVLNVNPYVQFFRSLGSLPDLKSHSIFIRSDPSVDQRRYNAPIVSQVAAIWVDDEESRDLYTTNIIVHCKSGDSVSVKHYFGCYDPLQYPLLFPFGESGWHRGIEMIRDTKNEYQFCNNDGLMNADRFTSPEELIHMENEVFQGRKHRTQVSCREYYCYKLQIRLSDKSVLLHAGRLLQQYVVDMYVKIETSRLDYVRQNQTKLRAELYQGIIDSVESGERKGKNVGRRIILPRTFIGSDRDLRTRFLDAMAIVQKYGKPDIFLTMTCNPSWTEINDQLRYIDEAQNRPDLTTRIFRSKLEELKKDLLGKQVFGPIAAYMYVIEFQKRGLPHAHFLLILKKDAKIVSPDLVDKFVCAEIPTKNKYPYLYSLVRKHMMHGPCGPLNPKNSCMKHNYACKFHFPKVYSNRTSLNDNSYPTYRRRDSGHHIKVRGHKLDNRWVVPYNPYLLTKYNCHMNVEICSSIQAVKYIYKYIYKGHDKIGFRVCDESTDEVYDEIKLYQLGRWVSPPEAVWRIYAFPLYDMNPCVISLQLHLENGQTIRYEENDDLIRFVGKNYYERTMLTEYFYMNKIDEFARTLLYRDFPEFFIWDTKSKHWYRRKRKIPVIGRIVHVSICEGERYYLRKILNHVKGSTSYEHLRIVNGIHASSFREAAVLYGLLNEDTDCYSCIDEASHFQMPNVLRQLFATVLSLCDPHNPLKLWDCFKKHMTEDYMRLNTPKEIAEKKALRDINDVLQLYGKTIYDYRLLDSVVSIEDDRDVLPQIILDELNVPINIDDLNSKHLLNTEQKNAFTAILKSVVDKTNGVYFIDGPGGTGKTFLYKALLADVRSRGLIGLACASSGVAAALLPRGRTAHSRFKIPILVNNDTTCVISKQSALADLCRMTHLIVWDEAPMVNKCVIECLDRMLKDICNSDLLFGGKVVVFGGDFRQILPIVQKGGKEETINATLVNSYIWPSIKKYKLLQNVRAKFDADFSAYLLRIGNSTEPLHTCDMIKLPSEIIIPYIDEITSVKMLIDFVFHDIEKYVSNIDMMINRVILSPKNENVDFINSLLIEKFPGESFKYYSYDEPLEANDVTFNEDFLNTFTPNGIPPHELVLKIDCPIILLRNLNPSEGLCNGTRLICKQFNRNVIDAEVAVGEYRGKRVFLPRIPFIPSEFDGTPFRFKRTQFPVRICFAMSINKAQGQTLDCVGLYLPESVFSHGQLYVALSRVKKKSSIKVLLKPDDKHKTHTHCTKNIVYDEVIDFLAST